MSLRKNFSIVPLGIQSRLIILMFVMLIPILGIQAFSYYDSYQTRKTEELKANLEVARAVGKTFFAFVQDILHQELAIGVVATDPSPLSSGTLTRLLQKSSWDFPAVRDFHWLNPQGEILASSTSEAVGIDISNRDYFQGIVSGRDWVASDLVSSKLDEKLVFTISRAIRDDGGRLLGLVVATVDSEKLDGVLALHRIGDAGVSLIDSKGMHVYRYPAVKYSQEQRNWLKAYPMLGDALKGSDVKAIITSNLTGKERLVGFTPVTSIGWVTAASRSVDDVMAPITSDLLWDGGGFLCVALTSFIFTVWISRGIARPIETIHRHTQSLGRGNWDERIEVSGPKEVQELAEVTNWMAMERKQVESALQESEERLQQSLNVSNSFTFEWKPATDKVLRSDSCSKILGLAGNEIIYDTSQLFFQRIHPDDRERFTQILHNLTPGTNTYSTEYRVLRGDGSIVILEETAQATFDIAGNLERLVGVSTDITKRKQAEIKLGKSDARLRATLRSTADEIWIVDLQGSIVSLSDSVKENLGVSSDNWADIEAALDQLEILRPDGTPRPKEDAILFRALRGEHIWNEGEAIRNIVTDQLRWREASAAPIYDAEGRIIGAVAIARDVTERRHAEEKIKASLAEKEVMLKEIHHRVKNNLQIISSLVSMQADNLTDERIREEFDDVCDRVRSMALIHEKLYQTDDMARLNFADYAASLLHALWNSHDVLAEKVRLNLELEPVTLSIETAVPCGLILNELAGNALKHAFPDGSDGEVTVGLEHDVATDTACLWVRDNGVGLKHQTWTGGNPARLACVSCKYWPASCTALWKQEHGPGTEFRVTFPLKDYNHEQKYHLDRRR
jgi:PAS domain S-box-containing protein